MLDWAGFKGAASYTFDDSQPSHIEHYAELQAAGVPLTFYLNSGASSQPNYDSTWMRAASDGHELGNHTAHHCRADLSGCSGTSLGSVAAEIDECSKYILDHYGQTCFTMASPFGDGGWNDPARMRFLLNRGVVGGTIAANDATDPFNLPTKPAVGGEAASAFSSAIDSARSSGRWVIFLFHSILPTTQNWYAGVDISSITGSIGHGKSLGDVLDRHGGPGGRVLARTENAFVRDSNDLRKRFDLDLDAPATLPIRQLPARQGRRRHSEASRDGSGLGRPRLLRDRARCRLADAVALRGYGSHAGDRHHLDDVDEAVRRHEMRMPLQRLGERFLRLRLED